MREEELVFRLLPKCWCSPIRCAQHAFVGKKKGGVDCNWTMASIHATGKIAFLLVRHTEVHERWVAGWLQENSRRSKMSPECSWSKGVPLCMNTYALVPLYIVQRARGSHSRNSPMGKAFSSLSVWQALIHFKNKFVCITNQLNHLW